MNLYSMAFFKKPFTQNKDGEYVINLDDKVSKGTHWLSLFIDKNTAVYFDSFRIGYIPQEVLNKIKDISFSCNIFRIQDNDGFYCIAFIECMLAGKASLDVTNLFSLNDYKKNDKIKHISVLKINMAEEASIEFRLRKFDETRDYLLEEIKDNNLMREKYKKTCKYLN